MAKAGVDPSRFIHAAQIGGVETYQIDDGPGRGVRALCVNTGAGLRYRVLIDRGFDIDQAFLGHHSLVFLTHGGVTPPTRALDRGLDWLRGFPGGLLTSCGPFNIGAPGTDAGEDLGLHSHHSNTAATIESIVQPDPRAGRLEMTLTAVVRYGAFYGPCVELRRTIRSSLGSNVIDFTDEFFNAGNQSVPHAWLLHINFGYPLLDEGAELCWDAPDPEPTDAPASHARFKKGMEYKRVPAPQEAHRGPDSAVGYVLPKPHDAAGNTTVGIVNRKLSLGVAVHYNTREFGRCGNWQHWGPHEYVTALEPMNGTVNGRWRDRESGLLDRLDAGQRRQYRYQIEVLTEQTQLAELLKLNSAPQA